jgi:GT2 family glycosyltransferase
MSVRDTITQLEARDKTYAVITQLDNNIYRVRNSSLSPLINIGTPDAPHMAVNLREDQKPFEGMFDDYEKIIWVDSDNWISAPALRKLLSYDVDIVAAWYRIYMGGPINELNRVSAGFDFPGKKRHRPLIVEEIPTQPRNELGLVEVDWTGFGLCVIKKGVFEAVGYPWFYGDVFRWEEDGVKMAAIVDDDWGFCRRARDKGFKIFIDPECYILHEKKVAV